MEIVAVRMAARRPRVIARGRWMVRRARSVIRVGRM